jgi:hypothetical protein
MAVLLRYGSVGGFKCTSGAFVSVGLFVIEYNIFFKNEFYLV